MGSTPNSTYREERERLIFRLLLVNKWFLIPTSVAYEWFLSNSPYRAAVYSFLSPTILYISISLVLIVTLWITHRRLAEGRLDSSYVRAAFYLTVLSIVVDTVYVLFLIFMPDVGNLLWFVFLPTLSFPLLVPRNERATSWKVDGTASAVVFLSIYGWFRTFEYSTGPSQFLPGNILICQAGLFFTWVSLRWVHHWIHVLICETEAEKKWISLWMETFHRFPADFFLVNEHGEILIASDSAHKFFPLPEPGKSEWPEETHAIRNAILLRFHSETAIEETIRIPDDTRATPLKIFPTFFGLSGKRYCIALLQEEDASTGAPVGVLRSDRLTIAGQIAAGLAHELGNPLGIIRSCAAYLRQKTGESDPNREEYELIEKECRRCQSLIDRLLSLASPKRDTPAAHDLRDILEHSVTLVKYQAGKRVIETSLPPRSVLVFVNEGQLSAVFVNLFLNALQSMELSPPEAKLRIHMRTRGAEAIVDITDEGSGIAPEDMEKIFDPFFTRRAEGTGLGLSIVHQIITSIGGKIDVASRLGSGTTFTVTLPMVEAEE